MITFQDVDKSLVLIEKSLNVLGWVPHISRVSGFIRATAGKVMAIAAFVLATLLYGMGYATSNERLIIQSERVSKYIWHGLANVIRGSIEMIPLQGNLLMILYDVYPDCRLKYTYEMMHAF